MESLERQIEEARQGLEQAKAVQHEREHELQQAKERTKDLTEQAEPLSR